LIKNLLNNKQKIYLLLSQIIIAIIGILTGKIIALYFSPEDFGLFNLQYAIYAFFFSLLISPFIQYMKTISKSFLLKIGYKPFLILVFFLLIFLYIILLSIYSEYYAINYYWYFLLLIMILSNTLFSLLSDYFNIYNRLNLFSLSNLLKSLVSLCFLGVLFFYNYNYNDGSIVLWFVQIIGFTLCAIIFLPYYKFNFSNIYKISINNFIKKYIKYAWPLIIVAFWSGINNYFDRFAIEYYLDVKSVGIYNASYALGSKFFILLNPFFLTLLIPNIYNNSSLMIRKQTIKKYTKIYTLISIPILLFIFFFNNFIGVLLLSKRYESGFYLIFWIALSYFFLTLVYLYETIFYAESKTYVILHSNIVSAVLNILLNILLIPIYGLNGAFISTLISFGIRFVVVQFYFIKL
jgi:O-antigen/teichoic acid export membrane protein